MQNTLAPDEVQFILRLVAEARTAGILEIQYKDLKLRLGQRANETGSGPVSQNASYAPNPAASGWSTLIQTPKV